MALMAYDANVLKIKRSDCIADIPDFLSVNDLRGGEGRVLQADQPSSVKYACVRQLLF